MLLPYTVAVILSEYWHHSRSGRIKYLGEYPLRLTVFGQVSDDEWVNHYSHYRDEGIGARGGTENRWSIISTKEVFLIVSHARNHGDLLVTYDYPRAEFTEALTNHRQKQQVYMNSIQVGGHCPFCDVWPLAEKPRHNRKGKQKNRPECNECYAAGLRFEDVLAKEGYFDDVFSPDPIYARIFREKGYIE